jgi:hypothetical protein
MAAKRQKKGGTGKNQGKIIAQGMLQVTYTSPDKPRLLSFTTSQ